MGIASAVWEIVVGTTIGGGVLGRVTVDGGIEPPFDKRLPFVGVCLSGWGESPDDISAVAGGIMGVVVVDAVSMYWWIRSGTEEGVTLSIIRKEGRRRTVVGWPPAGWS